jgi:hypothetical protein
MRLVCPAAVCRPICMGHAWSLDAAAWTGVILRRRCSVSGFRECAPGCAATPLGASTAACAVQAHTPLKCTGVPGERLAGGGDGTAVQLARAHAHDVPAAMQIQESCRPQHERARLNTTCKLGIAAPAASGGVCVWGGGRRCSAAPTAVQPHVASPRHGASAAPHARLQGYQNTPSKQLGTSPGKTSEATDATGHQRASCCPLLGQGQHRAPVLQSLMLNGACYAACKLREGPGCSFCVLRFVFS